MAAPRKNITSPWQAVEERCAITESLTQSAEVLVLGVYATESWKDSSFGNKILAAAAWREK